MNKIFAVFNTLTVRIAALLLLGLVVGQAISTMVFYRERGEWLARVQPNLVAQRVDEMLNLLDRLDTPARLNVAASLPAPHISFVDDISHLKPVTDLPAVQLAQVLEAMEPPGRRLKVYAPAETGLVPVNPWLTWGRNFDFTVPVRISAMLYDGTPVSLTFGLTMNRTLSPQNLLRPLSIIAAVMLVCIVFALRWVTAPLTRLGHAAEILGRDIRYKALDERGPKEVKTAARAFNRMQQRLLRFIDGRTEAVAAMSHDMRTPLTRLRLRAEFLPDEDRDRVLQDVVELQTLVEQTLAFMRDLGSVEAESRIDVAELVRQVATNFAEAGRTVTTAVSNSVVASVRPTQIRRAVSNLVDNALNYGGNAEVRVEAGADELLIAVRDAGPGIPEDQFARVVRPFVRVEQSRNRSTGGLGLGLAIVKDVAESHGGQLVLRNLPGGGFEAALHLPQMAVVERRRDELLPVTS